MSTSTVEDYPQLLSLAVHELRSPASVVGGYLRMLQRDDQSSLDERQLKMIQEAEKSCARIVALIAELSEVAKLDAGTITIARQRLDLFQLVAEVAAHVHEAADRGVRLVVAGEEAGADVMGDSPRLRQAFEAIFRAILREMTGPATLVAARRRLMIDDRAKAVVVISSDGPVQSAYDGPRERFDEKRGGLGLALPLARRVIECHGGNVWSAAAGDASARRPTIIAVPMSED